MHTNWNINVSFVIHVNFDHAWTEHYPITVTLSACARFMVTVLYVYVCVSVCYHTSCYIPHL